MTLEDPGTLGTDIDGGGDRVRPGEVATDLRQPGDRRSDLPRLPQRADLNDHGVLLVGQAAPHDQPRGVAGDFHVGPFLPRARLGKELAEPLSH